MPVNPHRKPSRRRLAAYCLAPLLAASTPAWSQPVQGNNEPEQAAAEPADEPADNAPAENAARVEPAAPTNLADAPTGSDVVVPFYGLALKQADRPEPLVVQVEVNSKPWEAGLRKGDYLLAFADVRDVPFDKFIEGIDKVSEATYEGDEIAVIYERDGETKRVTMDGIGRSPEDLREIQQRSQQAIEEARESADGAMPESAYDDVSTEDIEEYLELQSMAVESGLNTIQQRRLDELEPALVAGGYLGGFGGFGLATGPGAVGPGVAAPTGGRSSAVGGGANRLADGTLDDPTPLGADAVTGTRGVQPGSPIEQGLSQELERLSQLSDDGTLNPNQTRRLQALQGLSRYVNSSNNAAQLSRNGFSPAMQTEFGRLSRARQAGPLSALQRQRLTQLEAFRQRAISAPGANRNNPAFGAGFNNGGLNNGVNAGAGGVGNAVGVGGSGAAAGAAGAATGSAGAGSNIGGGSGIGDPSAN